MTGDPRIRHLLLVLLACLLGLPRPAAARPCADVALVLSVDGSGSIDDAEFALQVRGLAAAFRHPAVLDALDRAGRVDIAAAFWGDPGAPVHILDWRRLETPEDAARLADVLAATPRRTFGGTGLGGGLLAAITLLSDPARCALRRVVNVSGDGRASTAKAIQRDAPAGATNQETRLAHARALATARGITVNGLTIIDEDRDLTAYYRDRVITGPDRFVMEIATLDDFADAIVTKLRREILPVMVSGTAPPGWHHAPTPGRQTPHDEHPLTTIPHRPGTNFAIFATR